MMLKRSEMVKLVGLSYSTVHRLEKDGNFPSRRQLSAGRVAWRSEDIQGWLDSRVVIA